MTRKTCLCVLLTALLCTAAFGMASADYGYTSVSRIPMAVDFSFSVEFDDHHHPSILTDYPFNQTGATEMNLTYDKGDVLEVATLNYDHPAGETKLGTSNPHYLGSNAEPVAFKAISEGELTLDDKICINTSNYSKEDTDWFLYYSVSQKSYVRYMERTNAYGFNGMMPGGVERGVNYVDGEINDSWIMKMKEGSDIYFAFDRFGTMMVCFITRYGPEGGSYVYDPSTGLFDGYTITELGFDEDDLSMQPLAALEEGR